MHSSHCAPAEVKISFDILGRTPHQIILICLGSDIYQSVIYLLVAITKAKKAQITEKLNEVKNSSDAIVFVHYEKLSLADTTAMRKELRDNGVGYFVAKKTLIKRAFGDTFTGEMPVLDNEIAIAYSTDPMAPAQNMKEFAAKYKEKVAIVGGVFQGAYKDQAEMIEIASIPSLQVLRGMFVNIINSPIQGLVIALNAHAEKQNV